MGFEGELCAVIYGNCQSFLKSIQQMGSVCVCWGHSVRLAFDFWPFRRQSSWPPLDWGMRCVRLLSIGWLVCPAGLGLLNEMLVHREVHNFSDWIIESEIWWSKGGDSVHEKKEEKKTDIQEYRCEKWEINESERKEGVKKKNRME